MLPVSNYNPSYSRTLQTGMSPTTGVPQSKEHYYAHWSAWEKDAPQGGDELRDIAVARMRDCLDRNTESLDLSRLSLSSLPIAIPEQIRVLNVNDNQLEMLPEILPNELRTLRASNNKLSFLPKNLPNSIIKLNAYNNHMKTFPEHLPSSIKFLDLSFNLIEDSFTIQSNSLEELDLSDNMLYSLPHNIPNSLYILFLSNNKIQTLPEYTQDPTLNITIDLLGNPLSEKTFLELSRNHFKSKPSGPIILYSERPNKALN